MVRDLYFSLPSLPSFTVTNGSLLPVDREAEKLFQGHGIFLHFSTLPITLPSYKMLHHIVYSRWSPLLFITTYSCFLLTSCSGGILNYSLCLQSRVITSSHFVRPSMCCSLVTQFSKKQSYGNLQNSCLGIILCQLPRGKINRLCILFCSRFRQS